MNSAVRRTFILLLALFAIPVFGLIVSFGVGLNWQPPSSLGITWLGALILLCLPQATGIFAILPIASILALLGGIALPTLVSMVASLCGRRRERLVRLFGPTLRIVALLLSLFVLVQGVILTAGVALLEINLTQRVTPIWIGALGLGALVGAFQMIRAVFASVHAVEIGIAGLPLTREAQPQLWRRISDIAGRIGARLPDNVVLGLQPTFFATAAAIRLAGTPTRLKGETLYLSVSLLRMISERELDAILGHELAHFLGADTAYSLRFLPVHRGLERAMAATVLESGSLSSLALVPARAVLSFAFQRFAFATSAISRDREIEADRLGAGAADGASLIAALLKCAMADPAWNQVLGACAAALKERQPVANLSHAFMAAGAEIRAASPAATLIEKLGQNRQPHPTDTHPPIAARAAALNVPVEAALLDFQADQPRAIELIAEPDATELELTNRLAELMISSGMVRQKSLAKPRNAFEMKRDTLAKRAAARRKQLAEQGKGAAGPAAETPPSS